MSETTREPRDLYCVRVENPGFVTRYVGMDAQRIAHDGPDIIITDANTSGLDYLADPNNEKVLTTDSREIAMRVRNLHTEAMKRKGKRAYTFTVCRRVIVTSYTWEPV